MNRPLTIGEEQRLAARIESGDTMAVGRLAEAYLGLADRVLACRPVGIIDRGDLRQTAVLAIYEAAGRFRPGTGPFRAKAVRAILRACWRLQAAERRVRRRSSPLSPETPARPDDAGGPAPDVRAAMAVELTERQREVLRAQNGMGGRRASLTRSDRERAWRARRKLRAAMSAREAS